MEEENWENDSVDSFTNEREKMLLDKAGWGKKNGRKGPREEADDAVLDIESAKDRYLKKLQGDIDDSEEEYFVDKDREGEEREENLENWGGKGDYYGEEDENEQVGDVEEALRLQREHMGQLKMDDYMLDEVEEEWNDQAKEEAKEEAEERVGLNAYPEYVPLLKEFAELQKQYEELEEGVKKRVLGGYLGVIVCYLGVLRTKISQGSDMKDESVMLGVLRARELWRQASERGDEEVDQSIDEDEDMDEQQDNDEEVDENMLMMEEEEEEESDQQDEEEAQEDDSESATVDLSRPRTIKRLQKSKMDSLEQAEHKGRRKDLRFYTSKIENKDKRGQQFTGDDDLGYAESEFERRSRLQSQAQRRGQRDGPGENL